MYKYLTFQINQLLIVYIQKLQGEKYDFTIKKYKGLYIN